MNQYSRKDEFQWVGKRLERPDGPDKVTGRARFGADYNLPGQLYGARLLSPHPHARIVGIDTSAAKALPGVKAVITAEDLPDVPANLALTGEAPFNVRDQSRNIMARHKVLYEGHPLAAIAAINKEIAQRAVDLIEVEYEILPHVIDVLEAIKPDAPVLHEEMFTAGITPKPDRPSNVASKSVLNRGNVDDGFAEADIIVEREFRTAPVHQGYIEPHACLASVADDGRAELWTSTQGPWVDRAFCAAILGWKISDIRVTATEIGGGFGGKIMTYDEPLALLLSKITRKPVKMVMTREEVFKRTGPTSGTYTRVKLGATKDGKLVALDCDFIYQAGAFPGSPLKNALAVAFTHLAIPNVKFTAVEVVSNRPRVLAYRAPGGPLACYVQESVMDEMAERLGLDPLELIRRNAIEEGAVAMTGEKLVDLGLHQVVDAVAASEHYNAPLGPNQGRGVATSYWRNRGGQTSLILSLNEDGTISVSMGTPDIGGLRASVSMMVAETLGVDYARIATTVGDTAQLGYNFITGGSRATYASGMAAVDAAKQVIAQACERAAKIWKLPVDSLEYDAGFVRPTGPNAGTQPPMSLAEIGAKSHLTGGPIMGKTTTDAPGAGPNFGTHLVDVEVDRETGFVRVLRYTIFADVGLAIHPDYVEGQNQGGAAQGIGWALNEEYIYGADGRMQNAGFLDYRMPVASDLPMIDCKLIEVPNPMHPFGVRGVGEIAIVPSVAAVANAVRHATGVRFFELPMSPPKILERLAQAKQEKATS